MNQALLTQLADNAQGPAHPAVDDFADLPRCKRLDLEERNGLFGAIHPASFK